MRGGLGDWLQVGVRLVRGRPPAQAWGAARHRPSVADRVLDRAPLVAARRVALGVGVVWVWRRVAGPSERAPVRAAHRGTRGPTRDVAPLAVAELEPPTGRMLLGRMLPRGPLLATEDRPSPAAGRRPGGKATGVGRADRPDRVGQDGARRVGDRHVGRPGRRRVGEARPLRHHRRRPRARAARSPCSTPAWPPGWPSARWSPLEAVTTSSGALRTGRALAQAIPRGGVTNADYWAKHGENLLGAFMCVAGLSRLLHAAGQTGAVPGVNMEHIATWVTHDGRRHRPGDQPDPQSRPRQAPTARGPADRPPRLDDVRRCRQGGPQDPLVDLLHGVARLRPVAGTVRRPLRHRRPPPQLRLAPNRWNTATVHRPRVADGRRHRIAPTPCTCPHHSQSSNGSPRCSAGCSPT